ncbi:hypothetical protein RF11_02717 [Thelohanellus kitauei]|uniref:Uncharacterized protein n=1 Tax=Thelohanellus kitauei TaxID=669202 RepID=A0A0C2MUD7_THEKT|nr:hypothetical protein RF11_02717 [Thelohanellus kitauei]
MIEIIQRAFAAWAVIVRSAREKLQQERNEFRDITSRNVWTHDYYHRDNQRKSQKKNNFIIMEERSSISSIELEIELENVSSVACIDMGSQFSYIPKEFCVKTLFISRKGVIRDHLC